MDEKTLAIDCKCHDDYICGPCLRAMAHAMTYHPNSDMAKRWNKLSNTVKETL